MADERTIKYVPTIDEEKLQVQRRWKLEVDDKNDSKECQT